MHPMQAKKTGLFKAIGESLGFEVVDVVCGTDIEMMDLKGLPVLKDNYGYGCTVPVGDFGMGKTAFSLQLEDEHVSYPPGVTLDIMRSLAYERMLDQPANLPRGEKIIAWNGKK